MDPEPTVREVFDHVDPDPDAILAAFDVESPDELVETGGRHEPTRDDEIDTDDETAATVFARLESASLERSPRDHGTGSPPDDWEFVGEPETTVVPGDHEVDAAAAEIEHARRDGPPTAGDVTRLRSEGASSTVSASTGAGSSDSSGAGPSSASNDGGRESPPEPSTGPASRRSRSGAPPRMTDGERRRPRNALSIDVATDVTLVGPGPAETRVPDDAFGTASGTETTGSEADARGFVFGCTGEPR